MAELGYRPGRDDAPCRKQSGCHAVNSRPRDVTCSHVMYLFFLRSAWFFSVTMKDLFFVFSACVSLRTADVVKDCTIAAVEPNCSHNAMVYSSTITHYWPGTTAVAWPHLPPNSGPERDVESMYSSVRPLVPILPKGRIARRVHEASMNIFPSQPDKSPGRPSKLSRTLVEKAAASNGPRQLCRSWLV